MSKTPWFPFYHTDYLADTVNFSALEHGVYLLLMLHYWREGSLPNDETKLRRITRTTAKEWAQTLPAVSEKFTSEWRHNRIDKELARAEYAYQRRANAGRSGGLAKASNAKNPASNALATPCGSGSGSGSGSCSCQETESQGRVILGLHRLRSVGGAA